MTNTNDSKPKDTLTEEKIATTEQKEPGQKSKIKRNVFAKIFNLLPSFLSPMLLLLLLILVIMANYKDDLRQKDVSNQIKNLKEDLSLLKNRQAEEEHSQAKKNQLLDRSLSILEKRLSFLETQTKDEERLGDWPLIKARYYLELAQMNDDFGGNTRLSLKLLQEANASLESMSLIELEPIKQALDVQLESYKRIKPVDVPELLNRLDKLILLLNQLPAKELPQFKPVHTREQASSSWKEALMNNLNQLKTLVVIKHHEEKPSLPILDEEGLITSITLYLREAQWAVLQKNARFYQEALLKTMNLIKKDLSSQAKETLMLMNALSSLQAEDLNPQRPEIKNSLQALNELIDKQARLNIFPSKQKNLRLTQVPPPPYLTTKIKSSLIQDALLAAKKALPPASKRGA